MESTIPLYKNFVRLTLLEEVNPKYLIRFLRPGPTLLTRPLEPPMTIVEHIL